MKKTTTTAAKKCCAKKKTTATEKKATSAATKKVATKTTTKAPAKTTAKKSAATAKKVEKKVTRIVAHVDVGWGNMLYIRGEGAGLSWEQGVPMLCDNGTEWHWTAETEAGPISFKFLVNDETWASGENVTINAGDVHISNPTF